MAKHVLLVLLLLFSFVSATDHNDIIDLTDENFEQLTAEGKWLVDFFAPWCGHCKVLAPIFDEAAVTLRREGVPIKLAKVDCTVQTATCQRYKIQGYPTLKYIRGGVESEYTEGRTLDPILRWARRITGPSVQNVETISDFNSPGQVSLVFFGEDKSAFKVFKNLADKMGDADLQFGKSVNPQLHLQGLQLEKGEGESMIVLMRDAPPEVYNGPVTEDDLSTWILDNRFPLFSELTHSNFGPLKHCGKMLVVGAVHPIDHHQQQDDTLLDVMKRIAPEFKKNFVFVHFDGQRHDSFVRRHNVTKLPGVFILRPDDGYYSFHVEKVDVDMLRDQLKKIESGEISPNYHQELGIRETLELIWTTTPRDKLILAAAFIVFVGLSISALILVSMRTPAPSTKKLN